MNALSCTETNTQIHIRKKYHPLREDGILFQIFKNQILWITKPERSFGSNQVVFGGMILPVSAIFSNCSIETGYRAKATFISPLSTRFFSSPNPRIPPTKSIRLEVRKSEYRGYRPTHVWKEWSHPILRSDRCHHTNLL